MCTATVFEKRARQPHLANISRKNKHLALSVNL
jgi:hypothetical protein